jgi:NADPH:quinone reductase-like Zn-dependent oxidoreductase
MLAGGLGHFAVQYAKATGMRMIAVDGGDERRDLCKRLGAEASIDFTTTKDITAEIMRTTTYGAHYNEGRACDGAEFLASGRDDGGSRIAEGSCGVWWVPRR